MGNIIKLTESDLVRIINRVISEEKNDNIYDFIIDYITNQLSGLKKNNLLMLFISISYPLMVPSKFGNLEIWKFINAL